MLGLEVLVEQKGIVRSAYPRILIRKVPEGDNVNLVLIATKGAEERVVLVFVQSAHIRLDLHTLATELQLTAHLLIGADVEFGDVDVVDYRGIEFDGCCDVLHRRAIHVVVSLHTDAVDGHTCLLHLLHHVVDALALAGVAFIVVVVEEQGVGVGFTGKLESLGNEFVTAQFIKLRLTIRIGSLAPTTWTTVVRHRLVHHVPAIYHVLVAVDYGVDVFANQLIEHFLLHGVAFLVLQHPVGELVVPHQAVSTHLYAVTTAEVGNRIGLSPIPYAGCWMYRYGLHSVLAGHAVEFAHHDGFLFGGEVADVECHTHLEVVLIGIL